MISLREYFGALVDDRRGNALRWGFAWLAVLGAVALVETTRPFLAVWSIGRDHSLVALPYALIVAFGAAAFAFWLGVASRLSGVAACASLGALYAIVPATYQNNYYVLWLFLAISALVTNATYSVSLANVPGTAPVLAPRLMQWQLVIIYVGSVVAKLTHPRWQGTGDLIRALAIEQYPARLHSLANIPMRALAASPRAAAVADACVIGAELVLPLLLLDRRWRRIAFVIGAALHLFMQEWLFPQLFTFAMLLAYYAFVPSGDRDWKVHHHDARNLDRVLAHWFPRLDWLARTQWIADADVTMLTIEDRHGVRVTGFGAVLLLSVLTPCTLLAFATVALIAPGIHTVAGIPRAALENAFVALWALAWLPTLIVHRRVLVAPVVDGRD